MNNDQITRDFEMLCYSAVFAMFSEMREKYEKKYGAEALKTETAEYLMALAVNKKQPSFEITPIEKGLKIEIDLFGGEE